MKLMPTLMPLITRISRMITPINNQGSHRPWRNLPRNSQNSSKPAAKRTITTTPIGLPQMAATC